MQMILRRFCQSAATVGIVSLLATSSARADDVVFLLENNTSSNSILEFYASPQAAVNWEGNILNGRTLKNQERARITIPDNGGGCIYDLMAVFASGNYINQYGVDLCNLDIHIYTDTDLAFFEKNTAAETINYTFTLTNNTSVDMLAFYASPQTAQDWEFNLLGNGTIGANGDSMAIALPDSRGCFYDFLAVFEDGDKIDKYGINVCELETHTYFED